MKDTRWQMIHSLFERHRRKIQASNLLVFLFVKRQVLQVSSEFLLHINKIQSLPQLQPDMRFIITYLERHFFCVLNICTLIRWLCLIKGKTMVPYRVLVLRIRRIFLCYTQYLIHNIFSNEQL